MTKDQLERKVTDLERRVKELEAQPRETHFHYYPPVFQPLQPQTYPLPATPWTAPWGTSDPPYIPSSTGTITCSGDRYQ